MIVNITYNDNPPHGDLSLATIYGTPHGYAEVSIEWPRDVRGLEALGTLREATANYLAECLTRLTLDELRNYAEPKQEERTVAA